MNRRCVLSDRVPALQGGSLEFKLQKKKKKGYLGKPAVR
jgi:hypothetical protein